MLTVGRHFRMGDLTGQPETDKTSEGPTKHGPRHSASTNGVSETEAASRAVASAVHFSPRTAISLDVQLRQRPSGLVALTPVLRKF
jgi:hypothetical protein